LPKEGFRQHLDFRTTLRRHISSVSASHASTSG
jgi:hypothetical protein